MNLQQVWVDKLIVAWCCRDCSALRVEQLGEEGQLLTFTAAVFMFTAAVFM
jgi:hypothetical protein